MCRGVKAFIFKFDPKSGKILGKIEAANSSRFRDLWPFRDTVKRSPFDRNKEDEAKWLSGSLLLPRDALLHIRRRKLGDEEACETYGCSKEMLNYHLRVTGVEI